MILDFDGSILDSLHAKQERCFMPEFVRSFGEGAEKEPLEELWRYVSLDSRHRGVNRFRALAVALRIGSRLPQIGPLLRRHSGLADALDAWLAHEPSPSAGRLASALAGKAVDRKLARVLAWSRDVDRAIDLLPPAATFVGAGRILSQGATDAEIRLLSSSTSARARRELAGAGLSAFTDALLAQERGEKARCVALAMEARFDPAAVLVIGDAPVDLAAARSVGASFYPIVPGREEESWRSFERDFLPDFLMGRPTHAPLGPFLDAFATGLPSQFHAG